MEKMWIYLLLLASGAVIINCIDQVLHSRGRADQNNNNAVSKTRYALVITLAGSHKLADYFEWSCRSIYSSRDLFDLLVFHENNQLLQNVSCAENVKFYNLGERGLAELITKQFLPDKAHEDTAKELVLTVSNVLLRFPQYLSEVKPMTGSLFKDYLTPYTYWSYTDPDIIWGRLADWLDTKDVANYDLYTIANIFDASRLYLRGQFTLHRNTEYVNSLWKKLEYFTHTDYATRMATAYRMLLERTPTETVFKKNFHSPEGWYSQVAFQSGDEKGGRSLTVKVDGRFSLN